LKEAAMDARERERLIEQYAAGPAKLRAALAQAPEEMRKWRPAEGEFSVHEIVVHCADSETNSHMRIRYVLGEKDPLIVGYDQDAWPQIFEYHAHPLEPALAAVEAARGNTTPLLRRLPESAWAKEGKHTESGRYTAEDWLRIYAAHLEEHTAQLQGVVAAWRAAQV
jgi:hypothetical protein